jgi:hypothetical protein
MSEEASTRDGPQQLYLERGTISGCLHPLRMLTPFFDRAMRDSLRLSRVVSLFLAAIAQMCRLGVDGGAKVYRLRSTTLNVCSTSAPLREAIPSRLR